MKGARRVAWAFALAAATRPAAAQTDASSDVPVLASLHVTPAETCADAATLGRLVEGVLERQVFVSADRASLRVDVRFSRVSRDGWDAELRLSRGDTRVGARSLHSPDPSCATLNGPVGLVIALMVDAHQPQLRLQIPSPPSTPLRAPKPASEPHQPWRLRTRVDLRGSRGALPGTAGGLDLGSVLTPPMGIPVEVSLTLWPVVEEREGRAGGRFRLWHGGLGLCPGWEKEAYRLGFCSGVRVGELEGAGIGLATAEEPRHLWVQGDAAVDFALRLSGPFAVRLSAGAAVPLLRPEFVYTSAEGRVESVHRPLPVVPMAGIGIEANLSP